LALAVGLPDFAGGCVEAGQKAGFATGVGVDADEVATVEGAAGFLRGVAADDGFARVMSGGFVAAFSSAGITIRRICAKVGR
jgi:hypothetical protein